VGATEIPSESADRFGAGVIRIENNKSGGMPFSEQSGPYVTFRWVNGMFRRV